MHLLLAYGVGRAHGIFGFGLRLRWLLLSFLEKIK
jgi:hypothetical protein